MKWQHLQPPERRATAAAPAVPDYLLRLRRAQLRLLRSEIDRTEALASGWASLGCLEDAAASYADYRRLRQEAEALAAALAQEERR